MPPSSLKIERSLHEHGVVLLQASGIVDAQTFDQLESALQGVLDRGGNKIVVDLTQVGFISSAGIGVFMNAMTEARRRHGDLVLLNLSGEVTEVFEALHLTNLFHTAESFEQALSFLPK